MASIGSKSEPRPVYPGPNDALFQLSSNLQSLSLHSTPSQPSRDQCIAHLKLLECCYQLKEDVTAQDGLFGILNEDGEGTNDKAVQDAVREKKWAIYVTRAVERFRKWWEACVPQSYRGQGCGKLQASCVGSSHHVDVALQGRSLDIFTIDALPPVDVLMVWHSYLLNPRCFFEDCYRLGKMDFFATGLPWASIDQCIDLDTFEFRAPPEAEKNFQAATSQSWRNEDDPLEFEMLCPRRSCRALVRVPWTRGFVYSSRSSSTHSVGYGFADPEFSASCTSCGISITHETLRVQKFRHDLEQLVRTGLPLPGTVLSIYGQPENFKHSRKYPPMCHFPSLLVKRALAEELSALTERTTMSDIKDVIERGLNDSELIKKAKFLNGSLLYDEKVAVRRMMNRYWLNSSPFALDLVGAVVRQGEFIRKMHNIDWLHSPELPCTMDKFIIKYKRFFAIMAKNKSRMAVPTLCVDLIWHTHQLSPASYYAFSDLQAKKLIDHDDKIEETRLNNAFTWTSKMYQQCFGEPYSECTCWYCEAVRASHSSSLDRVFNPNNRRATEDLRNGSFPSDPDRGPHISLHSAVRDSSQLATARRKVVAARLAKYHKRAVARGKRRQSVTDTVDQHIALHSASLELLSATSEEESASDLYATNPFCIDTSLVEHGNCAVGSLDCTYADGGCRSTDDGGGGSCGGCGGCGG